MKSWIFSKNWQYPKKKFPKSANKIFFLKMPPLKQPKDLSYFCYSSISIYTAKLCNFYDDLNPTSITNMYSNLPPTFLENLFFWVIQASHGVVRVDLDEDDHVILRRYCKTLQKMLKLLLQHQMTFVEQDFTIDLRAFRNFELKANTEHQEEFVIQEEGIVATDENLFEIPEVSKVSEHFLEFVKKCDNLLIFKPGIFVKGRQDPDLIEQKSFSLCWNNPQVLINLVDHCENVTILSLEGFNDVNDLVLEYIAGQTEQNSNRGLQNLTEISLPKKSFVTSEGVKVLLENLPNLEIIRHLGMMGKIFEEGLQPKFGKTLKLRHFCQMESMTSGGIETFEDLLDDDLEMIPWIPDEDTVQKIRELCPNLEKLCLLSYEEYLGKFIWLDSVTEIEIHTKLMTGPYFGFEGLDCLAVNLENLTKISLTVLDSEYSWRVIDTLGSFCGSLTSLHLTLWSEMEESLQFNKEERIFPFLEELVIKCEDNVDTFPIEVFCYFMRSEGELKIVQFLAPMPWLTTDLLNTLLTSRNAETLEMLVLSNTSTEAKMGLDLRAMKSILEACPRLTVLGNLRTWSKIDYFDDESVNYFRSESEFCELKREAVRKNWDIDFDLENIDFLFKT